MSIEITDKASKELKKFLEKKNDLSKSLRIYIAGFGWGGPSFGLALDEQKDGDKKVQVEDFTFLLDEDMANNFSDFTIDYSDSWLRRGFQVSVGRGGSTC